VAVFPFGTRLRCSRTFTGMLRNTLALVVGLLALAACKKENDPAPATPTTPGSTAPTFDLTVNGAYGVRMTLGTSTVVTFVESDSLGAYSQTDGVENTPPTLSTRWYAAGLQNADLMQDRFRFAIGTLEYEGVEVVPSDLYAFLAPGTRTYGPATTGTDGVQIEYTDASGQGWTTLCGGGGQPTSTFQITDILEGYDKMGPKATIAATFSCTFYNCATGDALPVNGGGLVFELREF
jgi:hypothetical protein